MKSLIKMLWVLALIVTIHPLFANDSDPRWRLEPIGAKSFAVYLNIPVECTAYIRVMDEQGSVLLRKRYQKVSRLSKKINLSKLPAGTYHVEIEDRLKIQSYLVEMGGKELTIEHEPEADFFKPIFLQKGKYVDVCMLLQEKEDASINIFVFSSQGRLIRQEMVENQATFEKRFDVSNLKRDNYSFVVQIGDRTFVHELNLR
ncbi:MAG: hypothetical protein AAFV95_06670 [Bacteroidota bacterium]